MKDYALHAFIFGPDGECIVEHTFYGHSEAECEKVMEGHAALCDKFGPALKSGEVAIEVEELEEGIPCQDDFE